MLSRSSEHRQERNHLKITVFKHGCSLGSVHLACYGSLAGLYDVFSLCVRLTWEIIVKSICHL